MTKRYMIAEVIQRANQKHEYYCRERERMAAAMISLICTVVIGLTALVCMILKGCSPAPVPAYSLCEECGQVITEADHGHCQTTEVAACE